MIIYKVVNLINSKIYIGQTVKSLTIRWNQHKNDAFSKNLQSVLHKAIRKYGTDNFTCEEIYKTDSLDELNKKEIEFINLFKTNYLGGHGYNMLPGGQSHSGFKMSIQSSILKALSQNKAVTCIDTKQEFRSTIEAAAFAGVTPGYISNVLRGRKRTAGGYHFEYKNDTEANKIARERIAKKQTKSMGLLVQNTGTGEVFNSIKKAAKAIGVAEISLYKHLKGIRKTCRGSIFKVIGEYYGSEISK